MTKAFNATRLAAATTLLALALFACAKPQSRPPPAPLTVTVTRIESRPLANGLTAQGLLVSREEAGVASELAGYRVAAVLADEGDWVKKGQPLARLDDTLLKAQIAQLTANLDQQKVGAERAQAEADRVKGLDNQGVISQEQIIERRLAARSAQASVAVAEASLNDLKTRDSRMTIVAPVSGRVLERTARPGDTSALATTLFRIERDGLVELNAEINESDLAQVHVGDHATVTLPGGETVPGVVRFVSPRVDSQTRLGEARIALPVRPDLRPGGFASVVFRGRDAVVRTAPESAVHFDVNGAHLLVVDAQNRVHMVPVKTGARSNGLVQLIDGPDVGTLVALSGGVYLLDGDLVRPIYAAPAGGGAR
jgi:HlyD family secretion protein